MDKRSLLITEEYGIYHVTDSLGREGSGGNIVDATKNLLIAQGGKERVLNLTEASYVQTYFERVSPR